MSLVYVFVFGIFANLFIDCFVCFNTHIYILSVV